MCENISRCRDIFGVKCNEITSRGHTFAFDIKTKICLSLKVSYIYT